MAPGFGKSDFELMHAMDCGVLLLDPTSGAVVDATARAAKLFACPVEEVRTLGLRLASQGHPADIPGFVLAALRAAAAGQPQTLELMTADCAGKPFWLEINLRSVARPGWPWVMACLRDISRRKRAQEEQKLLHNTLTKRVRELECLYNLFTLFETRGISLEQVFESSLEKIITGWQFPEIACARLTLDDQVFQTINYRPTPWRQVAPLIVHEAPLGQLEVGYLEQRPPADDGPFLWEERALLDAVAGRLARMVERSRTQAALRRERDFAKNLLGTAQVIVLVLDIEGCIVFFNPFLEKLSGFSLEEARGQDWFASFRPPEWRDGGRAMFQEVMGHGQGASYLGAMLDRQGQVHKVEWSVRPLRDHAGQVSGLLCTGQDVTERLKVEQERNRLATAVEQAAECIIISDPDENIQYVNSAFERLTGYLASEVLGENISLLQNGQNDQALLEAARNKLAAGRPWSGLFVNRKKNGDLYEAECTISPIRDHEGRIVNYIMHQRDMTQERRLQTHLRQAQKMEAIGTLAGGIAHDFNNILGVIMGYSELARLNLQRPSHAGGYLDLALKASQRAKELVHQILTFSRQTEQERRAVDLNILLKESLKLLRATLPSTIEINSQTLDEPATVLSDPTQMHQVLMNLCTNAAHAMRHTGGRLEINLSELHLTEEESAQYPDLKPGPYLRLSVSDTGHGMTPETLERVFDPFFTTKAPGEGTGLGLAVVHGIVKSCGGNIRVYSELGRGTTFHVVLPQTRQAFEQAREESGEAPGGNERLLLVDDEEALVDILGRMLAGLGYQVRSFTDSSQALEAFNGDPEAFDLVLSDLTMPNLTGLELARTMKSIRPELPFILCTGFSESFTQQRAKALGIQEVILKPVLRLPLAEAIKRALGPK